MVQPDQITAVVPLSPLPLSPPPLLFHHYIHQREVKRLESCQVPHFENQVNTVAVNIDGIVHKS
jgi:hypothetical protein